MIFYEELGATVYYGHVLKELACLPDSSVDCVMTSPPYWGLRTYKTEPIIWGDNHCEHEWGEEIIRHDRGQAKDSKVVGQPRAMIGTDTKQGNFCLKCNAWRGELGLEPIIELYIEHLILIFNEVKRVLKKTGTCWVNIDDSYAGSGGPGGDFKDKYRGDDYGRRYNRYELPAKSLCLIPQRFAIAMVENGWILRNDICWSKPNPMPESVKDRFTGSWEHLFFFVKNKSYWFEQQFEAQSPDTHLRYPKEVEDGFAPVPAAREDSKELNRPGYENWREGTPKTWLPLGRNKRDVWEITTQPYPGAHFATFPEKLCETPILAGCPSHICKKCGKAREKVYETETEYKSYWGKQGKTPSDVKDIGKYGQTNEALDGDRKRVGFDIRLGPVVTHIDKGYTDCGCNAGFEPSVVLDPFCGSGKALAVAKRLGRKAIGIDLSPDYCEMTVKQLQAIPIPMALE